MQQVILYLIYGLAFTRFYQVADDIYRECTEEISPLTAFVMGLTIFGINGMIGYVLVYLHKLIVG